MNPRRTAPLLLLIALATSCGSRDQAEDAPALAAPTGIPAAAPGATGASFPARATPPPSLGRKPPVTTPPTIPPDPFGPELDDDEDGGAPIPPPPGSGKKKKGMKL